jgi:hypothetical protein
MLGREHGGEDRGPTDDEIAVRTLLPQLSWQSDALSRLAN